MFRVALQFSFYRKLDCVNTAMALCVQMLEVGVLSNRGEWERHISETAAAKLWLDGNFRLSSMTLIVAGANSHAYLACSF